MSTTCRSHSQGLRSGVKSRERGLSFYETMSELPIKSVLLCRVSVCLDVFFGNVPLSICCRPQECRHHGSRVRTQVTNTFGRDVTRGCEAFCWQERTFEDQVRYVSREV